MIISSGMRKTLFSRLALLFIAVGLASVCAADVPLPAPAPGGAPNIFYGGINPTANSQSPVLLFVHGLGSNGTYWFTNKNDMYASAYNAGYRTAYVSMNADNSNNHETISANARVLQTLLPEILTYFNTQQVYLVCHSKGGMDAQLAMMDATFRSKIKAVFTIATPNQGTALADWAFGPGQKLATTFGLLTPGLYDLRPEHVAQLRAQMDPVFQTAGIPFFYLAGGKYSGQFSIVYGITGPILANLTNGAPNDGLVAVPELNLPDSYAENLGAVNVDHTKVAFGKNAWSYVYGRIAGLENRLAGWQEIASGGFGDDENTWNWSQAWFQGNLYVGTGRNVNCVITDTAQVQSGLNVYPPPGNDCPLDPLRLGSAAEIWRYTPQTKTWARVFKSPQDIPLGYGLDGNPAFAARAIGFRGMGVYTEDDGTQALYVGGVSAISIYNTLPQYANGGYPPPVIMRTTDGVNFTEVPHDPGTFLGDIVQNNPDIFVASFRSIVQANGQMFVAATNFRGEGFLIASPHPSQGNNTFQRVSPTPATPNFAVWILSNYNNALYVGTGDRTNNIGYAVYKTTNRAGDPVPYQFDPIILNGGWQTNDDLRSPTTLTMHIWNQPDDHLPHLWVGTDRQIEILRINPDDSWDLMMGQPRDTPVGFKTPLSGIGYYFDNDFNGHIWQLQDSPNTGIHASTWDWSILLRSAAITAQPVAGEMGFDFFNSPDGIHWTIISKNGMGNGLNMGGRSSNFNHFGLFWGTARVTGGSQIWLDNSILDLNGDGIVSQADVSMVQTSIGQTVTGFDARDLNGNGVVDATDAQYLQAQCTFPGCSDTAPAGTIFTAPAPLFQGFVSAATQAAVGNTVVLNWPAQPGAARYHIYRYTTTDFLSLILPGGTPQTLQIGANLKIKVPDDILAGKLDPACPVGETDLWFCRYATALKDAVKAKSATTPPTQLTYKGYPAALQEIAQTTELTYSEAMPTTIQSLYFIRTEDANGNLTQPSNIVGAPSFLEVPQP